MKKSTILFAIAISLFTLANYLSAQSAAPFRAEYRKQAKGLLTLVNDKDVPMRVTLKPQSFTSDDSGHLKLLPLDSSINLTLAQTSLRIPPKETRYVAYEAKPKNPPAWLVIYVNFTPEAEGIVVGTAVPHFVYITAGDPAPGEIAMAAHYTAATKTLRVTITSHSTQLAHLDSVELSDGPKRALGSLSVLPGKSTTLELKIPSPPMGVKASGRKIKLQCPVSVD